MNLELLTKDQIRGIQLSLKACSKEFPFIKGFFLEKDNVNYKTVLFIVVLVDYELVSKFYNREINYRGYLRNTDTYNTVGIPFVWGEPGTEEYNVNLNFWSNEKYKVQNLLELLINALPEQFKYTPVPHIQGYCQIGTPCIDNNIDDVYGKVFSLGKD
jgi:hypothetical protein